MNHRNVIRILIPLIMVLVLLALGRQWWCPAGDLALWSFDNNSQHNSQHLLDWYTPSHISHGLIFYLVFVQLVGGRVRQYALELSMLIEASWEILENTDYVINRYREATIALDYFGDSIFNSFSDLLWCMLGFYIASRIKVRHTILLFLGFELFTLYFIRDNLTLNVLMLLWPIEAIKAWQGAI
ncbi:MAG: DUF2585 family protein [Deltaproteobacteria bacterium]|nr:DUF2585 family protein [Deltaproteobacteria bacterium]